MKLLSPEFKIKTYNTISRIGLEKFPPEHYEIGPEIKNPDAILLRSQDLHVLSSLTLLKPSVEQVLASTIFLFLNSQNEVFQFLMRLGPMLMP